MFYRTLKSITISLILLMSITSHSYADFYVIPVPKEVEVCNVGTAPGVEAFKIYLAWAHVGDVYETNNGQVVIVTGINVGYDDYFGAPGLSSWRSFELALDNLPEPTHGVKGAYYALSNGDIMWVDFL